MMQSFYVSVRVALLSMAIVPVLTAHSQFNPEMEVVIISCKTGTLFIDGAEIGHLEAEDALKRRLTYGDHYLQLKTVAGKISQIVTVDSLTKGILKIGCGHTAMENMINKGSRLFEKKITLTGLIGVETDENLFALDNGDEIILSCDVLNKKGSVDIRIQEYEKKTVIYQKERVSQVANEKIRVPAKGVYQLTLQTQALLGKDVQISVDRVPGVNSRPDFNTVARKVYDTTQTQFLTTRGRVYSTNNGRGNKTIIPVQLPPNTSYWVYWIGLDEQSSNELRQMTTNLASLSKTVYPDPLVYFGLKLISSLPVLNTPSTVGYFFADNRNAEAFVRNQPSARFSDLPAGSHIANSYGIVDKGKGDLALVLYNESSFTGVDFDVRAVAFTVKPRYVIQE